MKRTLGIMAKYWESGQVKTRLAHSLALPTHTPHPEQGQSTATRAVWGGFTDPLDVAARIHEVFVQYLLGQLAQSADRLELVVSPPNRWEEFQAVLAEPGTAAWQLIDQGQGDLGARMHRWFARHHQRHASADRPTDAAWVLIGADCPLLSAADLNLAWAELATHDLVLGPAFDGGYYLIGMSRRCNCSNEATSPPWLASLFTEMPWGTETVFERTLAAAEKAGLSVAILDHRHDVDTADDLHRLLATLQDLGGREHPLFAALCAMKNL